MIFEEYLKDLKLIFFNPEPKRAILLDLFLDYIETHLLNEICFKFYNNFERFVMIIRELDRYYYELEDIKDKELEERVKFIRAKTFQTFITFGENQNDKLEFMKVMD